MAEIQEYRMIRITAQAGQILEVLAESQKRSMSNQVEWLIEQAYRVVSVETLPGPDDAEAVPVVLVSREEPA